ncbi:hypothetical protein D6D08_05959 [Aureobasidium pullulans]|nr:hypothetical protein D6D08_05959 [Aureobasidium pullulans]
MANHLPPHVESHDHGQRSEGRQRRRHVKVAENENPNCAGCLGKSKPCYYLVGDGMSSQVAAKKRLKTYGCVLSLIRDCGPEDRKLIIQNLRGCDDLDLAVRYIHQVWLDTSEDQGVTPP